MTNGEITQDILEHCMSGEVIKQSMYVGCMQMAERKDAQFKEYLEQKKLEIGLNMGNPPVGSSAFIAKDCMLCLINEIINELFKEG